MFIETDLDLGRLPGGRAAVDVLWAFVQLPLLPRGDRGFIPPGAGPVGVVGFASDIVGASMAPPLPPRASTLVCLPGSVVGVVEVEPALLLVTEARVTMVNMVDEDTETCCWSSVSEGLETLAMRELASPMSLLPPPAPLTPPT